MLDNKLPDGVESGEIDTASLPPQIQKKLNDFSEVVAKRQELKEKVKNLEAELESFKTKEQASAQEKLLEEGKYKELLTVKEQEIEDQKREFEKVKVRAEEWDNYERTRKEAIKAHLGGQWVDSFSRIQLNDLEIIAEKLKLPAKVADTNNGMGNKGADAPLSSEEKKEMTRMGFDTEEGYRLYQKRVQEIQIKKEREKEKKWQV